MKIECEKPALQKELPHLVPTMSTFYNGECIYYIGNTVSDAGVTVSLYAMSPWVREKCYNVRVKISGKIHKHKRDKSR